MKHRWVLIVAIAVLAAGTVDAGSLAPAPRIHAKYERDFLERSGSQTLAELLDTGIFRYLLTGGQSMPVLVNGRPYATTDGGLDSLPISAIERIEILGGDSLGTLGGPAVRGALNVVLRNSLDGFDIRTVTRLPSQAGGDGRQGSVFWGGAVGKGRMTLGVDVLDREEIASQDRKHSRSEWRAGGAFNETQNVSVGGNTVWVVQRDEEENETGQRSVSLGDCDPAKGYTGPLSNPPGITSGDKGCGFAYGAIAWNSRSYEQQSAILNLDYPLAGGSDLRLDANFTQGDSAFRYAPSVGTFSFVPSAGLLAEINDAAEESFVADANDRFVVGHRFTGHGNRDWLIDHEKYDVSLSVEGRIRQGLGYDARISTSRLDGSESGTTFLHRGRIREEILNGHYDLANPFSDDPEHLRAIRDSSLQLERDFEESAVEAHWALEGSGSVIGGRSSAWTAGIELGRVKAHDISVYRSNDGTAYDVSVVPGSGGANFAGKIKGVGAFAEASLPLAENLDLRVAGRGYNLDDIGGMQSWLLGANYRPGGVLTFRGAWVAGENPPSMLALYTEELEDFPYIDCDPGTGPPPRTCKQVNSRQVPRVTRGNPNLDPSDTERLSVGAEARRGPLFVDVELYRLSRSGLVGGNTADWAMQNLEQCADGDRTDCIERIGGDITIYDRYANSIDNDLSGLNVRVGNGFRTDWGVVGLRGIWRRIISVEEHIAGVKERPAIPKDVVRLGMLVKRSGLSAVWTTNYRAGFRNRTGTGKFNSWTGHDVSLSWADPLGLKGAQVTFGVFNVTDTELSLNTANPSIGDGPRSASWGRTYFLTLNMRF